MTAKTSSMNVPQWILSAVLAAAIGLIVYFWNAVQKDLDGKVSREVYEVRAASEAKDIESLERRVERLERLERRANAESR